MSKPSERIGRRDAVQSGGNSLLERFSRARACPSQHRLEFGERLFNWREIGRVGWEKHETTAAGFNGLLDARREVNGKSIQDHDLPRPQILGIRFHGHSLS